MLNFSIAPIFPCVCRLLKLLFYVSPFLLECFTERNETDPDRRCAFDPVPERQFVCPKLQNCSAKCPLRPVSLWPCEEGWGGGGGWGGITDAFLNIDKLLLKIS